MTRQSKRDIAEPLSDRDYDARGRPIGRLEITHETYNLALGRQWCWYARYTDLPGYFGEGAFPEQALERLWESLGSRPHYRVNRKMPTMHRLQEAVGRKAKAAAAAALTRADAWGSGVGGGEAVAATAASYGIHKEAVLDARARLSAEIDSLDPKSLPVLGLSAETLREAARSAIEGEETDRWVAQQTPWRIFHAEVRRLFAHTRG